MRTYTLEELTDKHIGTKGTARRDAFENELCLEMLGQTIKQMRSKRNLTQSALGKLVGLQKSQISKVEHNAIDARFDTVLKVFGALGARVKFNVEMA
jgi:DNA-binding XRE family transcriptional regulator